MISAEQNLWDTFIILHLKSFAQGDLLANHNRAFYIQRLVSLV